MKKLLITISLVFLSFSTSIESDYCDGWEIGYCEGYKYVMGDFVTCPVTPICPVPELNRYEYIDGYNRAFIRGMKDADE